MMKKVLALLCSLTLVIGIVGTANASTTEVTVTARPQWTETAVVLEAGDTLSITAKGSWRHDT